MMTKPDHQCNHLLVWPEGADSIPMNDPEYLAEYKCDICGDSKWYKLDDVINCKFGIGKAPQEQPAPAVPPTGNAPGVALCVGCGVRLWDSHTHACRIDALGYLDIDMETNTGNKMAQIAADLQAMVPPSLTVIIQLATAEETTAREEGYSYG